MNLITFNCNGIHLFFIDHKALIQDSSTVQIYEEIIVCKLKSRTQYINEEILGFMFPQLERFKHYNFKKNQEEVKLKSRIGV